MLEWFESVPPQLRNLGVPPDNWAGQESNMKSTWDKLVARLACLDLLTDSRIEKYELQGRYGSARQEAARVRLMARIERRNKDREDAIRRRQEQRQAVHDIVADLI
jgi:hypothetical protein